ncbi:hypothetical protein GmHk_18G051065 [Glycine max]|nr:hypothetical protein GmHk_18G051065 [Glycine max]
MKKTDIGIKKLLTKSDLGNLSRLLLPKKSIEDLVLPVLSVESQREAKTEGNQNYYLGCGYPIHALSCLQINDEIGFHWNSYKNQFDFSVLARASSARDQTP